MFQIHRPTLGPAFSARATGGIRYIIRLCFLISSISALLALGFSQYRHQLTVLGERMGALNGPFLIFLALLTCLAGLGLRKCWSSGWNLAMLAGVIGLISGMVLIDDGGLSSPFGVLLMGLCLAAMGYLIYGPVVTWFRQRSTLATGDYEQAPRAIEAWLAGPRQSAGMGRMGASSHDLLTAAGFVLLIAYGFVYLLSFSGPAMEFTSQQYRFTISAPPGWQVARQAQAGAVVSLLHPDARGAIRNQPNVSIYVQPAAGPADDLSPEERTAWKQDWIRQAGGEQYPVEEAVSLAGLLAWKITLDHPRPGAKPERWMLATVKRGDWTFTLRCAAEAATFDQTLPSCGQVFERFRFLP